MADKPYYGIPLSNNRDAFIHIPRGISDADFKRITHAIENMKDVLMEAPNTEPAYLQPRKPRSDT